MDDPLTLAERLDFDRIVSNAAVMGWLAPNQQLELKPTRSTVVVRSTGSCAHERSYARTHRWLFEFLQDVAHGEWHAGDAASEHERPPGARAAASTSVAY
jgi:hypothetical protein